MPDTFISMRAIALLTYIGIKCHKKSREQDQNTSSSIARLAPYHTAVLLIVPSFVQTSRVWALHDESTQSGDDKAVV